jgi:hypothetical protein
VVSFYADVDRRKHRRDSHSGEHAALPGRGRQTRGDLAHVTEAGLGMARRRWPGALDEQARIGDRRRPPVLSQLALRLDMADRRMARRLIVRRKSS